MRSLFIDKLGIPRQANLVELPARVELLPPFDHAEAVAGLDAFSHLWLVTWFHALPKREFPPKSLQVRPPKLGGQRRVGVFASRSPYRPNSLGLSAVKLDAIDTKNGVVLQVSGGDLLDRTPILDIKPYLPYADHLVATSGYVPSIEPWKVEFTAETLQKLEFYHLTWPKLRHWLSQIIAQDPRPGYDGQNSRPFRFKFAEFDISFCEQDGVLWVTDIQPLSDSEGK